MHICTDELCARRRRQLAALALLGANAALFIKSPSALGQLENSVPDAPQGLQEEYSDSPGVPVMLAFVQADADAGDLLSFHIQVDNDYDFSSVEIDFFSEPLAQGPVSYAADTAYPAENLFWRVRSCDATACSEWSAAPNSAPDAPANLEAVILDGGPGMPGATHLLFEQSDPDEADLLYYELEVDTLADFADPLVEYTAPFSPQGLAVYTLTADTAGSNYFWRVRSCDGQFCSAWVTGPNNPPHVPLELETISLGSDGLELAFKLSDPDPGTLVAYNIQIDNDADFSSPEVDKLSHFFPQGPASHNVTDDLAAGEYYWRVRAFDGQYYSDWAPANGGGVGFVIIVATLDFEFTSYTVSEGEPVLPVLVLLSMPIDDPVTVHYATIDASAAAGSDYVGAVGELEITTGTSAAILLEILDDDEDEPDEIFVLTLSDPINAELGTSTASITIIDDDEGNGEPDHTVTLCHTPRGNPDNAHTIEVGPDAVNAHLGHGDTLGSCAGDEPAGDPRGDDHPGDGVGGDAEDGQSGPGSGNHGSGANESSDEVAVDDSAAGHKQFVVDRPTNIQLQSGGAAATAASIGVLHAEHAPGFALVASLSNSVLPDDMPEASLPVRLILEAEAAAEDSDDLYIVSIAVDLGELEYADLDAEAIGLYRRGSRGPWQALGRGQRANIAAPNDAAAGQHGWYISENGQSVSFWVAESIREIAASNRNDRSAHGSSKSAITWEYSVAQLPSFELFAGADPSTGGWVQVRPQQDSYTMGSEVTFTAMASPGYEFIGWDGISEDQLTATLTIASDTQVLALFRLQQAGNEALQDDSTASDDATSRDDQQPDNDGNALEQLSETCGAIGGFTPALIGLGLTFMWLPRRQHARRR